MRNILLIMLLLLSFSAFPNERADKIETLMRAQGLLDSWQQEIELGRIESKKQARKMINQVLSQINPNEKFRKKFEEAFTEFMKKVQYRWTAQQIVDVWAKFYGPKFTNNELDQLIAYYTSPLGKKDVQATKESMIEFTKYFQQKNAPIMEKALNQYITELKVTAKACKCPRKN